jgi:integrase
LTNLVYETIFALLDGLGLRFGEVVRLKLADADLSRDLLFIRETKFCKSRIVPLGPNLARFHAPFRALRHKMSNHTMQSIFSWRRGSNRG